MGCVISVTPVVGAAEPARVELRILADHQPVGNGHTAIDHDLPQPGAAIDGAIGQHHRLVQLRVGMHARAGRQQRPLERAARDDAIARDQRVDGRAAPPLEIMHELGRRGDLGKGPDRPVAIVEIELRHDVGEVDIGLPIGIDGAHVAPVGDFLVRRAHAGPRETMRPGRAVLHDVGNDVLAEIAAGAFGGRVAAQLLHQEARLEHVDAHRGEREIRIVGNARRVLRLFDEVDDAVAAVDMHHAEAGSLHARHLEAADGDIGAGVHMLAQHDLVVHLVDVVAGQQHDVARAVILDDVHVLVHGVGGAFVPLRLGDALARRQHVKTFVALGAQEVPAALQMADEAVRLVLRRHRDAADARVQRVAEREIDDARLAAEIYGRLGTAVGEIVEARAASPRQHIRHRLACQRRWGPIVCHCSLLARINPGRISKTALPAAARRAPRKPASSPSPHCSAQPPCPGCPNSIRRTNRRRC